MDDIFQVSVEDVSGAVIVTATGEIDVSTSPELRQHLDHLADETPRVVIDLTDVTFLDSTGLGVLVGAHKRIHDTAGNASVRLVVTRPQLSKVLEVTGLTHVFPVYSTVDAALAP